MYEIEKGIELPPRGHSITRYPWNQLEVGDSFFVPDSEFTPSLRTSPGPRKLRDKGWKFARRTITENGVRGVRFWRIK